MTKTVPRNLIQTALINPGLDEDCLSEDHPSPGTTGERCFALTFDNTRQLATFFLVLGAVGCEKAVDIEGRESVSAVVDDLENMIDDMRTDITGSGLVVSFPGWALV